MLAMSWYLGLAVGAALGNRDVFSDAGLAALTLGPIALLAAETASVVLGVFFRWKRVLILALVLFGLTTLGILATFGVSLL